MNEATIREAVQEADAAADYAAAVRILLAAGVSRYHTDVGSHTLTYYSDAARYVHHAEVVAAGDEAPPARLDVEALLAARRAIDGGETDYAGFLRRLWQAGVTEYDVDLVAGTITFRAADGATHVEAVPAGEA